MGKSAYGHRRRLTGSSPRSEPVSLPRCANVGSAARPAGCTRSQQLVLAEEQDEPVPVGVSGPRGRRQRGGRSCLVSAASEALAEEIVQIALRRCKAQSVQDSLLEGAQRSQLGQLRAVNKGLICGVEGRKGLENSFG